MKTLTYATLLFSLFFPKSYAITPNKGIVPPTIEKPLTSQNIAVIKAYAVQEAKIYGIDPTKILWILSKESQDCQNLTGDDGNSRGCMMISSIYHPEVSRSCAMNLQCSLQWSLNFMAKNPNNMNQWSTWSCRYAWYPDATSTLGPAPKNYKEPSYCK